MQGHRRRAVTLLAAAAMVGAGAVATAPAGAEPLPPAPAPLVVTVPGVLTVVVPLLLGGDALGIAFDVHSGLGLPLVHLGIPSLVAGLPIAATLVIDTDLDVVGRVVVLGPDG